MSIYIFLYLIISFLLIYVGILFYKKYRNIGGIGFLFFTIFISIWFIAFLLTYFGTNNIENLLYISRFAYGTSLLAIYSLLLFIIYFDKINKNIKVNIKVKFLILFITSFSLFTFFSPYIIESMYFNYEKQDYYENTGLLFNVYILLELIFFPLFFYFVFKKYKSLFNINKIRFKYILFGSLLFVLLGILFQLILPIFGVFLFEKEVILFILPLLFFTWYSITRYHFIDFSFRYKEIFSFVLSIFFTIILFIYIKNGFLFLSDGFLKYWGINNNFTYIDLFFGIVIYLLFYKLFYKIIPGNTEYNKLNLIINKWKEMIPFITNIYDLNNFLLNEIKNKFKISYVNIRLINNNQLEIFNYFKDKLYSDIFINDIVFIEENKHQFNKKKLLKEINKDINIIFPMFNNKGDLIGVFELGNKPFNEQYYSEEINIIKDFVKFLVGHLKYIDIYSKINDLNINLDRKVDEKTIEFNRLISKQREFISMSSHEIKTPVMSASLQVENLLDDIELGNYNKKYLLDEIKILKEQIFKISDLVKNIFSVQKYEIKDVGLYLEKVKLSDIIIGEYDILRRIYPNINFDINIGDDIGFIDIDKIQFTQVISNLLNNAIKFVNIKSPKIKITVKNKNDYIVINIEDNGKGFNYGEEKNIFEKYSTGKGRSVGIGLGLFLCKKIVELHGGSIRAENSKKLGGAKFKILIPKNNHK